MTLLRDVMLDAARRNPASAACLPFRPVVHAHYKQAIAAGLTTGDPAAAGLEPILADKSGSYFLVWPKGPIADCVVYLGSEGQSYVAAQSATELIAMLPYGSDLIDAMTYWHHTLTGNGVPKLELPSAATLEARRISSHRADAWIEPMLAAIESVAIACEPEPVARIGAANRAVLADWVALCERRFGPERVDDAGVRPYRATETFQVGERISHPTFGVGTVEAHLGPGKMTVAFASGQRVLVRG